MKPIRVLFAACLCALLCAAVAGRAADRDASFTDSIGAVVLPGEGPDSVSAVVSGETVVPDTRGALALVVGAQYGGANPHAADDATFWSVRAGLRWYARQMTSLTVSGEFGSYEAEDSSADVESAIVEWRQRLVPADRAVSPYLLAGAGVRSADAFAVVEDGTLTGYEEVDAEAVFNAGAGLELALQEDLCLGLQAVYTAAETLDDIWTTQVSMIYHWE